MKDDYDYQNKIDTPSAFDKLVEVLTELEPQFPDNANIEVIKRIIHDLLNGLNEFGEKTKEKNDFITISQFEELIVRTQGNINADVMEAFHDQLSKLNEDWLISKKKKSTLKKESS